MCSVCGSIKLPITEKSRDTHTELCNSIEMKQISSRQFHNNEQIKNEIFILLSLRQ
jgi:hypothetical protein